ncbi:hypothetical protein M885DRAFT_569475 [Pelagophyceae sp. CCMP2097]|nr:hypothetical protein M885DRAFT_569475 [Pelagophyceae sp. CCMP2097]
MAGLQRVPSIHVLEEDDASVPPPAAAHRGDLQKVPSIDVIEDDDASAPKPPRETPAPLQPTIDAIEDVGPSSTRRGDCLVSAARAEERRAAAGSARAAAGSSDIWLVLSPSALRQCAGNGGGDGALYVRASLHHDASRLLPPVVARSRTVEVVGGDVAWASDERPLVLDVAAAYASVVACDRGKWVGGWRCRIEVVSEVHRAVAFAEVALFGLKAAELTLHLLPCGAPAHAVKTDRDVSRIDAWGTLQCTLALETSAHCAGPFAAPRPAKLKLKVRAPDGSALRVELLASARLIEVHHAGAKASSLSLTSMCADHDVLRVSLIRSDDAATNPCAAQPVAAMRVAVRHLVRGDGAAIDWPLFGIDGRPDVLVQFGALLVDKARKPARRAAEAPAPRLLRGTLFLRATAADAGPHVVKLVDASCSWSLDERAAVNENGLVALRIQGARDPAKAWCTVNFRGRPRPVGPVELGDFFRNVSSKPRPAPWAAPSAIFTGHLELHCSACAVEVHCSFVEDAGGAGAPLRAPVAADAGFVGWVGISGWALSWHRHAKGAPALAADSQFSLRFETVDERSGAERSPRDAARRNESAPSSRVKSEGSLAVVKWETGANAHILRVVAPAGQAMMRVSLVHVRGSTSTVVAAALVALTPAVLAHRRVHDVTVGLVAAGRDGKDGKVAELLLQFQAIPETTDLTRPPGTTADARRIAVRVDAARFLLHPRCAGRMEPVVHVALAFQGQVSPWTRGALPIEGTDTHPAWPEAAHAVAAPDALLALLGAAEVEVTRGATIADAVRRLCGGVEAPVVIVRVVSANAKVADSLLGEARWTLAWRDVLDDSRGASAEDDVVVKPPPPPAQRWVEVMDRNRCVRGEVRVLCLGPHLEPAAGGFFYVDVRKSSLGSTLESAKLQASLEDGGAPEDNVFTVPGACLVHAAADLQIDGLPADEVLANAQASNARIEMRFGLWTVGAAPFQMPGRVASGRLEVRLEALNLDAAQDGVAARLTDDVSRARLFWRVDVDCRGGGGDFARSRTSFCGGRDWLANPVGAGPHHLAVEVDSQLFLGADLALSRPPSLRLSLVDERGEVWRNRVAVAECPLLPLLFDLASDASDGPSKRRSSARMQLLDPLTRGPRGHVDVATCFFARAAASGAREPSKQSCSALAELKRAFEAVNAGLAQGVSFETLVKAAYRDSTREATRLLLEPAARDRSKLAKLLVSVQGGSMISWKTWCDVLSTAATQAPALLAAAKTLPHAPTRALEQDRLSFEAALRALEDEKASLALFQGPRSAKMTVVVVVEFSFLNDEKLFDHDADAARILKVAAQRLVGEFVTLSKCTTSEGGTAVSFEFGSNQKTHVKAAFEAIARAAKTDARCPLGVFSFGDHTFKSVKVRPSSAAVLKTEKPKRTTRCTRGSRCPAAVTAAWVEPTSAGFTGEAATVEDKLQQQRDVAVDSLRVARRRLRLEARVNDAAAVDSRRRSMRSRVVSESTGVEDVARLEQRYLRRATRRARREAASRAETSEASAELSAVRANAAAKEARYAYEQCALPPAWYAHSTQGAARDRTAAEAREADLLAALESAQKGVSLKEQQLREAETSTAASESFVRAASKSLSGARAFAAKANAELEELRADSIEAAARRKADKVHSDHRLAWNRAAKIQCAAFTKMTEKAALKIQCGARVWLARRFVLARRLGALRHFSATAVCGKFVRRRRTKKSDNAAAVRIEAVVRGVLAREVQKMRVRGVNLVIGKWLENKLRQEWHGLEDANLLKATKAALAKRAKAAFEQTHLVSKEKRLARYARKRDAQKAVSHTLQTEQSQAAAAVAAATTARRRVLGAKALCRTLERMAWSRMLGAVVHWRRFIVFRMPGIEACPVVAIILADEARVNAAAEAFEARVPQLALALEAMQLCVSICIDTEAEIVRELLLEIKAEDRAFAKKTSKAVFDAVVKGLIEDAVSRQVEALPAAARSYDEIGAPVDDALHSRGTAYSSPYSRLVDSLNSRGTPYSSPYPSQFGDDASVGGASVQSGVSKRRASLQSPTAPALLDEAYGAVYGVAENSAGLELTSPHDDDSHDGYSGVGSRDSAKLFTVVDDESASDDLPLVAPDDDVADDDALDDDVADDDARTEAGPPTADAETLGSAASGSPASPVDSAALPAEAPVSAVTLLPPPLRQCWVRSEGDASLWLPGVVFAVDAAMAELDGGPGVCVRYDGIAEPDEWFDAAGDDDLAYQPPFPVAWPPRGECAGWGVAALADAVGSAPRRWVAGVAEAEEGDGTVVVHFVDETSGEEYGEKFERDQNDLRFTRKGDGDDGDGAAENDGPRLPQIDAAGESDDGSDGADSAGGGGDDDSTRDDGANDDDDSASDDGASDDDGAGGDDNGAGGGGGDGTGDDSGGAGSGGDDAGGGSDDDGTGDDDGAGDNGVSGDDDGAGGGDDDGAREDGVDNNGASDDDDSASDGAGGDDDGAGGGGDAAGGDDDAAGDTDDAAGDDGAGVAAGDDDVGARDAAAGDDDDGVGGDNGAASDDDNGAGNGGASDDDEGAGDDDNAAGDDAAAIDAPNAEGDEPPVLSATTPSPPTTEAA